MDRNGAAYDLSLFEARDRKRAEAHSSANKDIKVVRSKGKKRNPILTASVFCVFIALIATLIYSKVVLTEINDKISDEQSTLSELQGEATRLSLELEGKTSFGTIEEYATEYLGLSKVSSSQIEYIDLSDGNKIESLGSQGIATVFYKLKTLLTGFVEYIGF
jgi:cell division protein FtsL